MRMRMLRVFLFLCASFVTICPAGLAQPSTETRIVDWRQISPGVLDQAYEWLDAISQESDAIHNSDLIFMPRRAEADKAMKKLQRMRVSDADSQAYAAVVDFSMAVSVCRLLPSGDGCTIDDLYEKEKKATSRLDEIKKLCLEAAKSTTKTP